MTTKAYTSGSVSSFNGATGLLQALLDFVVGTEVSAENLSGSGVSWSGNLAHYPIGYGRLTINYTIGGVDYEGTDDGAGNITGTLISSGTIDYTDGAYAITFSSAVTGTPNADYLYGEPGQDWKLLHNLDSVDNYGSTIGNGCKTVMLQNRGTSGEEQVIVGIREWQYAGGNAYGWNLNGYLWYLEDMDFMANVSELGPARNSYNATYQTWSQMPNMPLLDATIYYWIFSNRQRIIVVAKVQSNYEACYLGFGNRYSPVSKYQFPLIIKGSHYGASGNADTGVYRRGIHRNDWNGTGYPMMTVDPGGSYRSGLGTSYAVTGSKLIPGDSLQDDTRIIGKNLDGEVFSLPVSVVQPNESACWMDMDGVYQLMCSNILSEDIVRDYNTMRKHIVFQDVYRTNFQDFYAVDAETFTTTTTTTSTTTTSTTTTT